MGAWATGLQSAPLDSPRVRRRIGRGDEALLLIDARTIENNSTIDADLCIVGAGPAGLTLARELAGGATRVALLESGGLAFDSTTQALYRGEVVGLPYPALDAVRLAYFGGSSNHWTGLCRPLDPIDFEARPWVPYSGWPFPRSTLDPYYSRAQALCQLGPFDYRPASWASAAGAPLHFSTDRVITTIFQLSPPTRFGQVYRADIERAANVSCYLHATALEIETNEAATLVTGVRVASVRERQFRVRAQAVVLAAGGIENARLLLLSDSAIRQGLGNTRGLVGRFFMEHPHFVSGALLLSSAQTGASFYGRHLGLSPAADGSGEVSTPRETPISGVLTLSPSTMRREQLLSFSATLELNASPFSDLRNAIRALLGLDFAGLAGHVRNVVAEIDNLVAGRPPLLGGRGPLHLYRLYNRVEQSPNPDSRVALAASRDLFGRRLPRLDWRLSPLDKMSALRAQQIVAQEVGRAGLGRLRIDLELDDGSWPPTLTGGRHHLGTTRMTHDPTTGVVDANCRVHGVANLFVAGSSVFPTGGSANPTLTIVALALRLAEHLKAVLASPGGPR